MSDPYALRRVSAKRLYKWWLYDQVEPFGELRADWRAASIRQMVFDMAVDPKHRSKGVEEHLLKFEERKPPKKQTWRDLQRKALMIVAMYNAPGVTE